MLAAVDANAIALERADGGVAVVRLEGEHDIYTAPELRERIYSVISDGSPLVIDLSTATFVDSSVLGVLLGARGRAHAAGLGFAVCPLDGLEPGVKRVLEVTGLMPVLPVLARDAAVEAARAGPEPSS
ncbi:MAG: anti-sigma factor antagonist [Solirubrobacteraceae bacterium]|nr:anti-sigma factor antagonist [Solirubrobacteraceae bacterium]